MSALSSLIIVLVLRGDKKGRDWFSFERIWKKTQTTQTQPSAAATSRSRLTAGCCRSRFVVALVCVDWRIDVYEPPDLCLPLPAKIDKQSKRVS